MEVSIAPTADHHPAKLGNFASPKLGRFRGPLTDRAAHSRRHRRAGAARPQSDRDLADVRDRRPRRRPEGSVASGRVELGFEHCLQELASSISKLGFNRVEPVVEKMLRCLDFRLRQANRRDMACLGVISPGASTAEPLVRSGTAGSTKLEITPPSFSNHSRYGTRRSSDSGIRYSANPLPMQRWHRPKYAILVGKERFTP
jgi:hypothetical protein